MFEQRTVIVLGAGASAPFGFPLGQDLYTELIAGLGKLHEKMNQRAKISIPQLRWDADNIDRFDKDKYLELLTYIQSPFAHNDLPEGFVRDDTDKLFFNFLDELKGQTAESIDVFISDNFKYLYIGKLMLALNIFRVMYDRDGNRLRLKPFGERMIDPRPVEGKNWYHGIVNRLIQHADDAEALRRNNLTVITFNYDHSLEQALATCYGRTGRHMGADYKEAVDILHVNGGPKSFPETITNFGEFILSSAKTINLVGEEPSLELKEIRALSQNAIMQAKRIYIMGFNFDSANLNSIGINASSHIDRIICLNYDGNLGLQKRMTDIGISNHQILGPSPGKFLSIPEVVFGNEVFSV